MENYQYNIIEYINSNNICDLILLNLNDITYIESIKNEIVKNICNIYNLINLKYKNNLIINNAHIYCIQINVNQFIDDYINKMNNYNRKKDIVNKLSQLKHLL